MIDEWSSSALRQTPTGQKWSEIFAEIRKSSILSISVSGVQHAEGRVSLLVQTAVLFTSYTHHHHFVVSHHTSRSVDNQYATGIAEPRGSDWQRAAFGWAVHKQYRLTRYGCKFSTMSQGTLYVLCICWVSPEAAGERRWKKSKEGSLRLSSLPVPR